MPNAIFFAQRNLFLGLFDAESAGAPTQSFSPNAIFFRDAESEAIFFFRDAESFRNLFSNRGRFDRSAIGRCKTATF